MKMKNEKREMSKEEEREFRECLMRRYRREMEEDESGELKKFRDEWLKKVGVKKHTSVMHTA